MSSSDVFFQFDSSDSEQGDQGIMFPSAGGEVAGDCQATATTASENHSAGAPLSEIEISAGTDPSDIAVTSQISESQQVSTTEKVAGARNFGNQISLFLLLSQVQLD